jgi:class 3 adenylate cyclase
MVTRNLSIMFTDIKGFTQRTSASSREEMKALLAQHERLLVPVFTHFDGTIVKTIGDAFLVYFDSPTDAVLCGVTIQEVLRQYNDKQGEDERIEVRVAINVGEVELTDSDVMGEAVNIAARLEGVTEAGEVWFTDAVYQTMNRSEAPSAEVGERVFKGIPHPIRVYKVIHEPDSDLAKHLAHDVSLADGVPQLTAIRVQEQPAAASKSSRCRRTALASLTVLMISAVVVFLIPSTEERALEKTQQLLAEGNPSDALMLCRVISRRQRAGCIVSWR